LDGGGAGGGDQRSITDRAPLNSMERRRFDQMIGANQ